MNWPRAWELTVRGEHYEGKSVAQDTFKDAASKHQQTTHEEARTTGDPNV